MAGLMEKDYGVGWFDAPESAPAAPGYGNYLSLPQQAPQQAERMDPKRMLWAGTLMDIGNAFGNALAGTGASQGNAMRLYGHAKEHNNSLDAQARERAEALRQQKIEAEDRALQRRLIESKIGKYEADSVPSGPSIVGSPQKLGNGNLGYLNSNGEVIDTGEKFYDPVERFSANGGEYIFDPITQRAYPVQVNPSSNPQPLQPQNQGGGSEPEAQSTEPVTLTSELSAKREAERKAAIKKAEMEAEREAEMKATRSQREKALAVADQNIQRIDELMKPENWNEVGFGMIEGRLTGGTPFFGSQWDDEFDSISAVKLLENMENMGANPTDADMAVARSISLDRSRGREYNEKELGRVREILMRNLNDLKEKLGIETQETDDDLVNKYLD